MNKETLKKPWMIALIVFAVIGLVAVGFLGSQMILGRQIRGGFPPRSSFGSAPFRTGENVGGEIVALSGDNLSLESPDGEVFEFIISEETEVSVDGGIEALEVGAFAFVQYETADDGSLVVLFIGSQPGARGLRIGPAGDVSSGGDEQK